MALQEAKAMGLDLMPDPETFANAPRDQQTSNQRAKYLYDTNLPEDWGSTASESGDDLDNLDDDAELAQYMLETGGLTDREIDRLDGKTSSRLGVRDSTAAGGVGAGPNGQKNYPERETGANTGPKGVLADQKYHQQQQLQERLSNQQAFNARMIAKAPTTTTFREDQARERREKKAQGLLDSDEEAALDADNEKDDAEERAILERIRGNRLKDMSWAAQKGGNAALAGKKVFGSLMEMNAAQYVSAIDSEKKDVTVVIHIYSEFNPASKRLDGCLIQLAGRYATTKFIRIKAREVDFDEEVCPTVLVYRAGDLIANLVMISYELSEDFDSAELEELLTKHKVISPHDQYQRETSFFDTSLDALNTQLGDLNMMGVGLGSDGGGGGGNGSVGAMGYSSSGASRRGILSGNVKEFRYQDDEDDDDRHYDDAEY
ncbi:hypothetical protein BGZ95_004728 [Linnemannia exigua]|uniref:Phosducin domain-containing protein n=1 Tax=Linnemannia exigua TaxID=604196 RepID=A0AAD4DHM1_9FUNG|nr:hypothetical protein BGZ95_004728 [Linnemannia exigua]